MYRCLSVDTLHYNTLVFYLCDEKVKILFKCLFKERERNCQLKMSCIVSILTAYLYLPCKQRPFIFPR